MVRTALFQHRTAAAVALATAAVTVGATLVAGHHPAAHPVPLQDASIAATAPAPALQRNGATTQLMVDGHPYLALAGELHNSDSSSVDELNKVIWPSLGPAADLNTVLVPVSWAQWEPTQGHFDPTLVDDAITQARKYHKRVIFTWFGSWKNSDSSYAPSWVKNDSATYPLSEVAVAGGTSKVDVLSPFGTKTQEADATAYAALMNEIRRVDAGKNTVVMMQVENEVGLLSAKKEGTVSSRDESAPADAAWKGAVPKTLTGYLTSHKADVQQAVLDTWTEAGGRTSGTWSQVFGTGPVAQEIFMAWRYGSYVNAVAAAGKAKYSIPMYVNTWIVQPSSGTPGGPTPGQFPSGGAVSDMHDVWRAAAPDLDLLAPDIYLPQFSSIYDTYNVDKNQTRYPAFVGESSGAAKGAANSFYAVGQGSLGYAPFGIETYPTDTAMKGAYATLHSLSGRILDHQKAGTIRSAWLNPSAGTGTSTSVELGGYKITFTLTDTSASASGYAIAMADSKDHFTFAGSGVAATFTPLDAKDRTASVDEDQEGTYTSDADTNGGDAEGTWHLQRVLNGDEISSGYYFGDQAAAHQSPTEVKLTAGTVHRTSVYQY